jgi:hypothetical protein
MKWKEWLPLNLIDTLSISTVFCVWEECMVRMYVVMASFWRSRVSLGSASKIETGLPKKSCSFWSNLSLQLLKGPFFINFEVDWIGKSSKKLTETFRKKNFPEKTLDGELQQKWKIQIKKYFRVSIQKPVVTYIRKFSVPIFAGLPNNLKTNFKISFLYFLKLHFNTICSKILNFDFNWYQQCLTKMLQFI